ATKPPYHPEFRAQAVQLVKDSGKTVRQIAVDLGISYESLRKWVRQAVRDPQPVRSGLRELPLHEIGLRLLVLAPPGATTKPAAVVAASWLAS
ncbi:MAG: transposase, partial [Bacillota bacterium]|nr:transposase [Bacillota bacterium]